MKKPTDWPTALSRPGPTLFIRGQSPLSTAGWWKESPPTLVKDGNCIWWARSAGAQWLVADRRPMRQWGSTTPARYWRAAPTAYDGGLTTPSPKGPPMKFGYFLTGTRQADLGCQALVTVRPLNAAAADLGFRIDVRVPIDTTAAETSLSSIGDRALQSVQLLLPESALQAWVDSLPGQPLPQKCLPPDARSLWQEVLVAPPTGQDASSD